MEKKLHTRKRMIKIVCVWYIKTDSIVIYFFKDPYFLWVQWFMWYSVLQ